MRWFEFKGRTYNLDHIKAFEVEYGTDGTATLMAVYAFPGSVQSMGTMRASETVSIGTFDSVEAAENCITEILQGDHDLPLARQIKSNVTYIHTPAE